MEFFKVLWSTVIVAAPYLLLGLTISGLIKTFVPMEKVRSWLGKDNLSSVLKASLIGVPLPLCSCSVIPTAVTLRKSGASRASVSSFLISTPESGIDSMAVTYALMDLPMTILRPVAAFFSALVAGVLQMTINRERPLEETKAPEAPKSCCGSAAPKKESLASRLKASVKYGFSDLVDDIAVWLSIGLLTGAIIEVGLPAEFFQNLDGTQSRFLILAIGIPVYICASATTPIAASLVLKGMSPGTALLLLLVGPATNVSNILVLQKYIGKKAVFLNALAVIGVALIFSYATDFIYQNYISSNWLSGFHHNHEQASLFEQICGVGLAGLLLKGVFKEKVLPYFTKKASGSCCG